MVSLHFKDPVKMQADTLDVLIDVLAQDKELMDLFAQTYPETGADRRYIGRSLGGIFKKR